MRFAIINEDGTIRQINDSFGGVDTIDDVNSRLPEGQMAIECGPEVTMHHVYTDGAFAIPE